MKLFPEYQEDISRIISFLAVRYYKTIGMDIDDLIQELWVFTITKDFSTIELVTKSLTNYCNRLYYNNKIRYGAKDFTVCPMEFSDTDESFLAFNQGSSKVAALDVPVTEEYMFKSLFKKLDDKSYVYVIVKAYLSGNYPRLKSKYVEIIEKSKITPEQENLLNTSKYNDDLIAKYLLGYESGTHSCSFRLIRKNLKELFKELCIY